MQLHDKLIALGIPCDILRDEKTYFGRKIYLTPCEGVTVSKIQARIKDLQLFFGVNALTLSQDGTCLVLSYDTEREALNFTDTNGAMMRARDAMQLPINAGRDEDGAPYIFDLAKAPHLLIAGTTGSGKSVFINDIIVSLLQDNKANLTLIDPKQVELSIYEDVAKKALDFGEVIKTPSLACDVLRYMCEEMDARYKHMGDLRMRSFEELRSAEPATPYRVIIIDELADLILTGGRAIERYICRIAQLGRACGFHLVVATQRPSADIITGLIRANFPSRCAFLVSSAMDSRIILDTTGAEKLRGKGAYIMKLNGAPMRQYQAPFISTQQILELR